MDINCLVCHQLLVKLDTPKPPDKDKSSTTVQDLTSHFTKFFNFSFDSFFEHFDDSSVCPSCTLIVRKIGAKLMKPAELEADIGMLKGQFENQLISGYKSSLSQSGNSSPLEWDRHFHHRSHLVQGLGLVQNKMEEGDHDDQDDITPHEFLQIDFEEEEEGEYGGRAIKSIDKNVSISLKKLDLPTGQTAFKLSDLSNKNDLKIKIPTRSKLPKNRQIKEQKKAIIELSDLSNKNDLKIKIPTRSKLPKNRQIKKLKKKAIIEKEEDGNSGDFMYCKTSGCVYRTRFQNLMNDHTHLHLPSPTHEVESSRIFHCDVCFKGFPSKSGLNKHQDTHRSRFDRGQTCHVCGKVLKNKVSFDIHMKTHTESSFICSVCGKSLMSKPGLKLHMMRCLDKFSFKCSKCPKKYVSNAELTKHVRITHDGSSFNCNLCGKKYSTRIPLNVHLRSVHTGEKPYKCSHCEKIFASLRGKNLHQETHNQNVENFKYQCKFCDKKFLLNKYLHQHLTRTKKACKTKYLQEKGKNKIVQNTEY